MKIWVCIFEGKFIGGEAVVVAGSKIKAKKLLEEEFLKRSIIRNIDQEDIIEVPLDKPVAIILSDGDY